MDVTTVKRITIRKSTTGKHITKCYKCLFFATSTFTYYCHNDIKRIALCSSCAENERYIAEICNLSVTAIKDTSK